MSQIKQNILANFAGRAWSALMGLAFLPLCIRFLGIEAYGLVGFYASLQAILSLFDLGLSTTLNREIARRSARPDQAQEMADLLRTLEIIYWGIAIAVGLTVLALAPLIAHNWVHADRLAPSTVEQAVELMGLVIAFEWPLDFYLGGLLGLQRQVLFNSITACFATLRGAGAVLVLWLISPSIQTYFDWQGLISAVATIASALALWRNLPLGPSRARFRRPLLLAVWRFAAGLSGISVLVLILSQLDKVILSKLLPLEMFGYYSLAGVVANGIFYLITPFFTAMFPRFSQLVADGKQQALADLYHRGCQAVSVAILPVAVVVALFAPEVLLVWTGNPTTVANAHILVSLLIVGSTLNGLMNLPYALQLAHGWTSLAFYANLWSAVVLVPMIIVLATRYGAIGGAIVWILLNCGYFLIGPHVTHRRILVGEQWRWYFEDIAPSLIAALLVAGVARWLVSDQWSRLTLFVGLATVLASSTIAAALASSELRAWLLNRFPALGVSGEA